MAHYILSLWLLVARLGPHAYGQRTSAQENHTTPVSRPASSALLSNFHFAFSLYQRLVTPNPGRNVLFSPLSLSVPLTLLALQAKPKVRTQILHDLGFRLAKVPDSRVYEHYSELLGALLPRQGECQTDTGSVLFLGQSRNPMRNFSLRAQSLYRTEILPISFRNSHTARHQMDLVIQKKTKGKIKALFQGVKLHSVLILANYMLFKENWKYSFNPKATKMMPFSVNKGLTVRVPMMQRLGWFQLHYLRHIHSHILRVPCACNTTAVFVLPEKGKVTDVEKKLTEDDFDKWTQPLPLSRRKLYFPRFSLTRKTDLEKLVLSPSGLDVFGYSTGLSGISVPNIPLRVSKALHKVELIMDEEGTEEENVTSFKHLHRPQVPHLHFNKPFLLFIFKESSPNLLFMGKVMNPKAS